MTQLRITTPHFTATALDNIPQNDQALPLVEYVKNLANIDGFTLSQVSINTIPIKLYCSKGGRKQGKTTNKTDCPFKIRIISAQITNGDGKPQTVYHIAYNPDKLHHNHEMTAKPEQILSKLDANTEASIHAMLEENIHPQKIKKVIERLGISDCTSTHIRLLRDSIVNGNDPRSETDQLIEYVKKQHGYAAAYDVQKTPGVKTRYAVFVMLPEEKERLENFGDVIFIDTTFPKTKLKWSYTPITVTK